MPYHSLLQRQVKRHLDSVDTTVEPWRSLLASIDDAYRGFDADREMVERSMELSSAELLEASSELRAVAQAFPDLILHIDWKGVVVGLRGVLRGGIWATERILHRHVLDLLPSAIAQAFVDALGNALSQQRTTSLEFSDSSDGAESIYEIRLAPLGTIGAIAIVRDVTERRRTDALRVAMDATEAASRAKSAFIANMSHELRTPLNAIIGYSELLAEDAAAAGSDALLEDLRRIGSAGRHLLQIVNAVLDVSKIEAGRVDVNMAPVEIAGLVDRVMGTVRPLAAANGNRLETLITPGLEVLVTDATKLLQILINLLGNACKFSTAGTITLHIHASDDGSEVAFEVRDTGIGIPEHKLSRLFEDFMQVDESVTRRYGGTGLGLAISRRLCDLLGGRIDVKSRYGEGSTFTVRLPARGRTRAGRRDERPDVRVTV